MVTVVCSSQNQLDEFKEHVIKTSGLHNKLEFLGYENKGEFSLTEIYNRGLREAKNNIVVFMHDDIIIEKNKWAEKIIKLFDKNPDYGVIGVAGTKYLSSSGRWWEDPKKMYGKVSHTHEGKTWLSSYSEDLGNELEEVVLVDGVFFAVNKDRLKNNFNEDVKGFHFYDVNFCVENYLSGIKIGVTTLVRINHMSIGMTNDKWEENRQNFADKFKENLPLTIKKVLRKNEKLNIMFVSLTFDDTTQKSNIILELSKKLKNEGHNITICSNMNGKLPNLAKNNKIILSPIQQPPGFLLGDGNWKMNTQQGEIISQKNTLYKIKEEKFNIIHIFDDNIIEHFVKLYPNSVFVNTKQSNSLFVNDNKNEFVSGSINISNDLNDIIKLHVNELIKEYENYL
jgi:hypothetical protein